MGDRIDLTKAIVDSLKLGCEKHPRLEPDCVDCCPQLQSTPAPTPAHADAPTVDADDDPLHWDHGQLAREVERLRRELAYARDAAKMLTFHADEVGATRVLNGFGEHVCSLRVTLAPKGGTDG